MGYSSDHLIPLTVVSPCLQLYGRYVNIYRSAISFNLLEDNVLGMVVGIILYYSLE